jgi:hypothetical protein
MNWTKAFIAGVVGGIALWVYNFLMHGLIMANTYTKYEVFREDANPIWFVVVTLAVGITGALLFAKTRTVWAEGIKGGLTFGFFVGLVAFFYQFYNVLMFEGFPYHLSWCWGGIIMIGWLVYGAVASLIYKK